MLLRLKAKDMNISTGGLSVAVLNSADALLYDVHPLDRLRIINQDKVEIVVVDITKDDRIVPKGVIGLFDEAMTKLSIAEGTIIEVEMARKPRSLDFIRKKLDGKNLTFNEYKDIISDIVHNRLSDVELTYFVAACYCNPLSDRETVYLTKAMTMEGQILKVNRYPIVDKHCIGGVPGNRTTMILVPIVAAAGVTIPKTSSRSITSPAGTADTMEVLCDVCIGFKRMKEIVEKTHGCLVWGGALNLAPADDKIIQVEKPMVIDAQSQLIASIISKKLSVSSTHILIDIPFGVGAKVETRYQANKLKNAFNSLSHKLGVSIKAIITDGSKPIGKGIGPALEARDVLWLLQGHKNMPNDLKEKSIMMAGIILETAKKAKKGKGRILARRILESGRAYEKFIEIIKEQGQKIISPYKIPLAKFRFSVKSKISGKVTRIDNKVISRVARVAGAPVNPYCGVYLNKDVGDRVKKGETLMIVYAGCTDRLKHTKEVLQHNVAYHIHH